MKTIKEQAEQKINGKQVNLILAIMSEHGFSSNNSILEWLEYNADCQVKCLEDVTVGKFNASIKPALNKAFNLSLG